MHICAHMHFNYEGGYVRTYPIGRANVPPNPGLIVEALPGQQKIGLSIEPCPQIAALKVRLEETASHNHKRRQREI